MKKNWLFYLIAVLAIMAFFTVSLGGCGGSSSNSGWSQNGGTDDPENPDNPDPENPDTPDVPNPTRNVWEQDTVIKLSNAKAGFDFDNDGRMDFLDFEKVGQFHLGENTAAAGLPRNSSYRAASEAKISVPAMVWLQKLRPTNENPNIFQVYLDAGKEYTFEFSKNFTEGIGANFPELQIFDPENAALDFNEASHLVPEITPVPAESPSLICYTIKPAVSGYYLVRVSSQKSSTETYAESEGLDVDDEAEADDTDDENSEADSGCVVFVYQEYRNEDGEPGYYTRHKFADINGNKTGSLTLREIIQLRKLFLEANPDYFKTVYGQGADDDEFGESDDADFSFSNDTVFYLNYMDRLQAELGLVDASTVQNARASIKASKARIAALPEINTDNDEYGDPEDSADIALREYYNSTLSDDTYSANQEYSTEKVLSDSFNDDLFGGATGTITSSEIQAAISGIPFEPTYRLGATYSAITNLSPAGGVYGIGLDEMIEQTYASRDPLSTRTLFWTELITTREESEKHSEVSAGGSMALAKNAAGGSAKFSVGTSSNYKYGLTSATLVIHFEVTENDYRLLTAQQYNDFALDNKLHKKAKKMNPYDFRRNYGDYFVAGYQYGACFEANIAITTETMEQLDEVKASFEGSGTYNDVTASVDLKTKINNTLNKSGMRMSLTVITSGIGSEIPSDIPITHSADISGIEDLFSQYVKFHKQVMDAVKAKNHKDFIPIRVYQMRWRSLPAVADQMIERWDDDGTIPITPEQMGQAQGLNSALMNLRSYYNAASPAMEYLPVAEKNDIDTQFNYLMGSITGAGEAFYTGGTNASGDKIADLLPRITNIGNRCKDYADRYTFYRKLVQAQKTEKEIYNRLVGKISGYADDSGDSKRLETVREMPFGEIGGGSSGFQSFPVSAKVTEDFHACAGNPTKVFDSKINKEWACHQRYYHDNRQGGLTRLEWFDGQRANTENTKDWQEDLGDAHLQATVVSGDKAVDGVKAVFAYVGVSSSSHNANTDRRRYLSTGSSPAVGKTNVGFRFMSGHGDAVDWLIKGVAVRLRESDYPFAGLEE